MEEKLQISAAERDVEASTTYSVEERLQNSATEGDVEALYSILAEDPCVLERIDQIPFVDTPLHKAASAGKIHLAKEILSLKPSFAWKRNHLGRSPIHLALDSSESKELVTCLISLDSELVRVKAKGMVTPLHYAAQINDDRSLARFLYVCPSSIKDLTVKSETAVHVALKNRSFRAFKVLFGWLQHFDKEEILDWQNEDGDTALHIATSTNQLEAIKLLIGYVEVNEKNKGGFTALDIFYSTERKQGSREVENTLLRAKAKRASELDHHPRNTLAGLKAALCYPFRACPISNTFLDYVTGKLSWNEKILKIFGIGRLSIKKVPLEVRNVLLVVAVLVATATYQAALSPPGGYWQDDGSNPSANNAVINTTITTNSSGQGQSQHRAGQMIMGSNQLAFFLLNSGAFYMSVSIILMLIAGLHLSMTLLLSTNWLTVAYTCAVAETFPSLGGWGGVAGWVLLLTCVIACWIPMVVFLKERMLSNYGRRRRLPHGLYE